jgi:membrane associated rhomboid family serine protease
MIPIRDTIPHRRVPVVTWLIIAANLAVFVLIELPLPLSKLRLLFEFYGLVPARYTDPDWFERFAESPGYWPFFTSMFLHGGWLHVIGNMWTLSIFGDNVEDRLGRGGFLAFYLLCGALAGALHVWTNEASPVPTVGASGAIAGVMGAYFILYPRARVVVLVPLFYYPLLFTVPAATFLVLWFLSQVFSGVAALAGPQEVGGVAWWAHVGGFAAGALLHGLFLQKSYGPRRGAPPFLT